MNNNFENINEIASVTIPPGFLWITLIAALIIFGLVGLILIYHWIKFSRKAGNAISVIFVYSSVSIVLFLVAFATIGYYQVSF